MLLMLALLAPAAERCGPSTCGDGEVCCNASCGSCIPEGEDQACLMLHCGWERGRVGGSLPTVPMHALRGTNVLLADTGAWGGRVGDDEVLRVSVLGRLPVSPGWVLVAGLDEDGRIDADGGLRRETLTARVVATPPTGAVARAFSVSLGARLGRDLPLDGGGRAAVLSSATSRGPFQPEATLGTAWTQAAPRWLGPDLISASFEVRAGARDGDPALGWHASLAASRSAWSSLAPALMIAGEAERDLEGTVRLQAPVHLGVVWESRAMVGLEGGPVAVDGGGGWSSGAFIGARLRLRMTPAHLDEARRLLDPGEDR